MKPSAGIAGAGLMGRLMGVELGWRGWRVTLFDSDDEQGTRSCTWASAGMIAPAAELESAEPEVVLQGVEALKRWPQLAERLDEPVDFRQAGSLVVAHPDDRGELARLQRKVEAGAPDADFMRVLGADSLRELEPGIAPSFRAGLFMTREGHVDNRLVLKALALTLKHYGATWHAGMPVERVHPHELHAGGEAHAFDWVIDCRGMGAGPDLHRLRGVRGELIYVSAPEVKLRRPVRLMHPRYPIYIVPRREHVFVVGATAIESEDASPITVRSTLELLSAAYTVHTGFAEGRVLETVVGCRPAFPDNRPRVMVEPGLMRINGLYRHGFLLAPVLSHMAVSYLDSGRRAPGAESLWEEVA